MNFIQIAQAVKRETGLSGGDPSSVVTATGDDARIFQWVNWAWRDIQLLHESWLWRRGDALGETSVSTLPHDLALSGFGLTDFGTWMSESPGYKPSTYRVSDGQGLEQSMRFLKWDEFRSLFIAGVHTPGPVQFWTVAPSGLMHVGPTPDAAHKVRASYIKDVQDMTLDADVPAMPARYHSLIVWRALIEYGGFDAAGEVVQRAERNYQSMLSSLLQDQLPQRFISARPLA